MKSLHGFIAREAVSCGRMKPKSTVAANKNWIEREMEFACKEVASWSQWKQDLMRHEVMSLPVNRAEKET